jgi:hypothetical protein
LREHGPLWQGSPRDRIYFTAPIQAPAAVAQW